MTPPKQFLTSVEFIQLKGLKNLKFSFGNKKVTAIFGTNGCGKSTILHALACLYRPVSCIGEKNYFTRFFKKENKINWTGTIMSQATRQFHFPSLRQTIGNGKQGE